MNHEVSRFKFSIIIPIFNAERYLSSSIKSIIRQSINFKKNVQIILINDGSTDKSEIICKKYLTKYPKNIIYIKQKNYGVSRARNNGIEYATGKYVNFLDADDKWKKNSLKKVWNFFEKNYNEIDLVACRIKLFGINKNFHPLDYKFKENKIIEIVENDKFIQLNGPTTFVKREVLENIKFNEQLKYGEDPLFVNEIIINKGKYGVIKDAVYYYRKTPISVTQNSKNNVEFYSVTLEKYLVYLLNKSKEKYGKVLHYFQNLLIYELYWRIKEESFKEISNKELEKYKNIIKKLIVEIDDELIFSFPSIEINSRLFFLILKYGEEILKDIKISDNKIIFRNKYYSTFTKEKYIEFHKFRVNNNNLIIHGKIKYILGCYNIKYYMENISTKEKIYAKLYNAQSWEIINYSDSVFSKGILFKLELPIKKNKSKYKNMIEFEKNQVIESDFTSIKEYNINNAFNYFDIINKKIIIFRNNIYFGLKKYVRYTFLLEFLKYIFYFMKHKNIKAIFKSIFIFIKYLYKAVVPLKNIILLESNPDYADSTKCIFDKFIENKDNKKYKIVWLVKNPEDFKDIKIDNVEFFNIKFLTTKVDKKLTNYYRRAKIIVDNNKYVKKFNNKQIRIHINHGSPFKDARSYNINIGEVDHLIIQSHFFANVESEIRDLEIEKLLPYGFPRNDLIYKNDNITFSKFEKLNKNKIILWLPTYKKYKDNQNSFGLNCINNIEELKKLNEALIRNNTYIVIKFHPAERIDLFENFNLSNILVIKDTELKDENVILYQLFNKVDALITDYSSVYYDFCLTKKNIGLAISDIDKYKKEKGEFEYPYEEIMIGNYMYNIEDLHNFVEEVSNGIDKTLEKRMKVLNQYDDYKDGNSTQRVYDLIKKYM